MFNSSVSELKSKEKLTKVAYTKWYVCTCVSDILFKRKSCFFNFYEFYLIKSHSMITVDLNTPKISTARNLLFFGSAWVPQWCRNAWELYKLKCGVTQFRQFFLLNRLHIPQLTCWNTLFHFKHFQPYPTPSQKFDFTS